MCNVFCVIYQLYLNAMLHVDLINGVYLAAVILHKQLKDEYY